MVLNIQLNIAIYFPVTSCVVVIGSEYRSWSVFCFLSSAITRIVSIGIIITKTRLTKFNTYSKLATAWYIL